VGAVSFLVVLSLCLGVAAWLFFLWAARSGQYDDVEGPKYRMLDEEDEERDHPEAKRRGAPSRGPGGST